jgi:hypothetical protein
MTQIDAAGIFSAVRSHAMTLGLFESVSGHEAINPPGHGLHYEVWAGPIRPIAAASGLSVTSAQVIIQGRIKVSATREPRSSIETDVLSATDRLLSEYTGAFQLGLPDIRSIDVLGMYGAALEARPGYITQDAALFRVVDITIPIIVNDAWQQLP